MSEHAQRIGPEAACNTHHFWNASPQAEELNQGSWLHLENYSGAAANKYRSVWVIAGPIFDPATPRLTIGDLGEVPIEIPDAFFKDADQLCRFASVQIREESVVLTSHHAIICRKRIAFPEGICSHCVAHWRDADA